MRRLISFGAVYHCPILPEPKYTKDPDTLARLLRQREEGIALRGRDTRLWTPRRARGDCAVPRLSYLRVHCHPKRFPAAEAADWPARVLAQGDHFVVVDKPWGTKVASSVDNDRESVAACAARAIGHPAPELLVSRRAHPAGLMRLSVVMSLFLLLF